MDNRQKLDSIITAYKAIIERKKPIELELRAVIQSAAYRQLYEKLDKSTIVIEQSLNLMRSLPAQHGQHSTKRRTIIYHNGKSDPNQTMMEKTTVKTEDLMHGFRIGLAIEAPLPSTAELGVVDVIRFRHRVSCMWVPDWQLDLTMVWQLTGNMMSRIHALRDEFFDPARLAILAPDWPAPSIGTYAYEVEVEYKGTPQALTIETLRQQFEKLMRYVAPGTVDREYNRHIAELAERINADRVRPTLKDISNNPRIFTLAEYSEKIYPDLQAAGDFFVCEKTDGDRVWIVARAGTLHVVTNTSYETQINKPSPAIDCVIDAEYNSGKYYAFDLLLVDGVSIVNKPYEARLALLPDQCAALVAVKFPITVKEQTRTNVAGFTAAAKRIMAGKHRTEIDGLIFSRADTDYYANVYKWKPITHQTADFLIISGAPLKGIDPWHARAGYTLYILFCSANVPTMHQYNIERIRYYKELLKGIPYNEQSFPLQFQHASNPYAYMYYHPVGKSTGISTTDLHGHVGEFLYVVDTPSTGHWELQRMRPDRDIGVRQGTSYGNGLTIADITYTNVVDPITLDHLSAPPISEPSADAQYFSAAKAENIKPAVKYNAFVKAMVSRQFTGAKWLLDLCCGQGQDMFVYAGYRVANLIMVDRDVAALKELNERKASLTNAAFYKYAPAPPASAIPPIYTYNVDIGELTTQRASGTSKLDLGKHTGQRCNVVTMNFALHYFCGSTEQIDKLLDLIDGRLEPGGIFMFTCFGGRQVHHILKSTGEWKVTEDAAVKYHIVRKYKDSALTPAGQLITVKLPFAAEAKEEYLVNIDYVVGRLITRGYQLRQNASFGNWFGAFAAVPANEPLARRLSDDDKKFCSLYQYVSLRK